MAGTSTSSGLNNLLADTQQVQTTLPSWMDTAQQNIANQASSSFGNAPTFEQTAGQGAVNTLQGANNPFTSANTNLSAIASGAANPWITDPNTGTVTPNTNTAMGGLFQAQRDQLNQLLPSMTSGTEAGAIGSGNFGSLRGQTAVDTAKANALSTLQAQQMQSALQNQQTGVQAGIGQGNVGAQGITAGLTTGAAQMNAPFQGATNYANLINSINAPTTVSQQNQMSPLSMIGSLANAPTIGTSLLDNLFGKQAVGTPGQAGYIPGITGLLPTFKTAFGGGSGGLPTGVPTGATLDPNGSGNYTFNGQTYTPSGTLVDTSGSVSSGGSNATTPTIDPTTGQVSTDPNQTGSIYDPNSYGAG
jgi:hypothetical protein